MNERDYNSIPAGACTLVVGEVELGDNGAKAKTAPVRLTARSGKPIEHWFWGRVVHDLSGMHLHKPRIPIDYAHSSDEVIGYLNRFDSTSGDLIVSGALVPFRDGDRASEIMHKSREGVPYEASINFGGDGLKIQEVGVNEMAAVNGFDFEGPGVIVREWPLRGVAICPYGADANTESRVLSGAGKKYAATVLKAEPDTTEETEMIIQESVEAVAPVAAAEEKPIVESVNEELAQPVDGASDEAVAVAVESPPAVDSEPIAEGGELAQGEPVAEPVPVAELSRVDFLKVVDEFGAEIAAQVVRDGGDYTSALKLAYDKGRQREADLLVQVGKLSAAKGGRPAPVNAAPKDEAKGSLFKTGK